MIKKAILTISIIVFTAVNTFAFETDELSNIKVYEKLSPAIVSIEVQIPDGISSGSGCIINSNGIILTSAHILENSKRITVTTNNGKTYKASIVQNGTRHKDLALIQIISEESFSTVKLGNSSDLKVGQKVLAIGNPFGFNGTLTQGIISRIDYTKNKIQTDAAINPGSSGGPLINTSGEVIGINQAIFNPDNNISNIGIGFAIPINTAKEFLAKAN